jgi:uncharacterized glyoxalase superfamily protein PhnB
MFGKLPLILLWILMILGMFYPTKILITSKTDAMAKFSYTILYVQNVTTTIEFYEKAFGFKRKFIAPDNSYGELNTGNTTLSFASVKLAESNLKEGFIQSSIRNKPFAMELGITTDDVEKLYDHAIKSGAMAEAPAKHKPLLIN